MLSFEQQTSVYRALSDAQIRHGDTTEVELAVGTMPSPEGTGSHLAFCSAWVRAKRVLKKGSRRERRRPIAGDIVFTNGDEVDSKLAGRKGIAYMRGTVSTNGHVGFTADPDSIDVMPVSQHEESSLRNFYGQALSRQVLAEMSEVS